MPATPRATAPSRRSRRARLTPTSSARTAASSTASSSACPTSATRTAPSPRCKDCGVPILIQAYPDELDKMAPEVRRDAFCGKFSIMDVFCQYGLKFTALKPHTVSPTSERFRANVDYFDRVCRVVERHQGTACRRDRRAHHGVQDRAHRRAGPAAPRHHDGDARPVRRLRAHASREAGQRRLQGQGGDAAGLHLLAGRARAAPSTASCGWAWCSTRSSTSTGWTRSPSAAGMEMQKQLGISPCVLLSEMNDRGIPAACEVDVGNAVTMYALSLASGRPRRLPGLEQQLRRRRRQVHPLPLRPGARRR